ncbi:MAG: DNA repair protein RecO [Firmicutes bacterium]|nr:DNA repair protein RecO [Bacillota bacterium]
MAQYTEHILVLKVRPYQENDSLVTVFGLEFGKRSAIAKGVRRGTRSKMSGLYPLSYAVATLYRGRSSLENLMSVDLIEGFAPIRDDLFKVGWAMALADIVDELWSERDASVSTFKWMIAALQALAEGKHAATVSLATGWHLLQEAGYALQWQTCQRCGAGLQNGGRVGLHIERGGLICGTCLQEVSVHVTLSMGAVRTIQQWMQLNPSKLGTVEARGVLEEEIFTALQAYMAHQLGRLPRAWSFLQTTRELSRPSSSGMN